MSLAKYPLPFLFYIESTIDKEFLEVKLLDKEMVISSADNHTICYKLQARVVLYDMSKMSQEFKMECLFSLKNYDLLFHLQ